MNPIHPAVPLVGATIATAVGVGYGLTKVMDGIAARHPTGSGSDGPSSKLAWSTLGAGVAIGALGGVAFWRSHPAIGGVLAIAGIGTTIGALGAGLLFGSRHGIGVETETKHVLDAYDDNDNKQIDMDDDDSFWGGSELNRTVTTTHSNGKSTYTTSRTYSIDRLANKADADDNHAATREELLTTIRGYDVDQDGRLKGNERDKYRKQVGER